ncbi:phosphoribosylformylglycinamidine synthase [Helicobacter felis]|uniref:phosphoribosylformylglycinamidine synthase n=1 Tax=Helicobacter felis TaxID=214 RepID=UPI000CF1AA42|nr:phosphoribosylformylglycinamidine synthase [Helicobacter felis]
MIVYVCKKEGFDFLERDLCATLKDILAIPTLEKIICVQVYLLEGLTEEQLERAQMLFCTPQTEICSAELDLSNCAGHFALQTLKGQFDPRSHAALQCLQMLYPETPNIDVECATIYKLYGQLNPKQQAKILNYLQNPLENHAIPLPLQKARTLLDKPFSTTLKDFSTLTDFSPLIAQHQLSLRPEDLRLIQEYLPHLNALELKILDTFWSDHCRHGTFFTELTFSTDDPLSQEIYDLYYALHQEIRAHKPISLMDLSTLMGASLKKQGRATSWVQSEENNACTLAIELNTPTGKKPYYLFFKNETHNHPTEIEPYGGASTCIGGAIRDPLSARGVVYAGIRISGCANPLEPITQTRAGKLPQRKIALGASEGFSAYGNQIGVATGLVAEIYHEGYKAKHLELGAVLGAAPQENVRSLTPVPGDIVLLVGGRTGRDGLGGASGSSQAHSAHSIEICGAQVQKGDAPEERKLQRLMQNPQFSTLIKRCNDLGAGGVSVALGELSSSGIRIDLSALPTKYTGLSAFDLALSESQERMAMLIDPKDLPLFEELCALENLLSAPVATITTSGSLEMVFEDKIVANIPMSLLHSQGAKRHADAYLGKPTPSPKRAYDFLLDLKQLATDLNFCSQRGLVERFDSTIGSNTIFMPLGGKYQATPIQAMAHLIPFEHTSTCSLATFGFDPHFCAQDPTRGGYCAVVESVCKLIACGARFEEIYLSFQEYFESLGRDALKWGKPFGVLLGAFLAQHRLQIPCIGGKDSMSGSFEDLSVPPSFISFAFCAQEATHLISAEFKAPNHFIYLIQAPLDSYGLPYDFEGIFERIHAHILKGHILAAYALGRGGVADALIKMSLGNRIGVNLEPALDLETLFVPGYGNFVVESACALDFGVILGKTMSDPSLQRGSQSLKLEELLKLFESPLESLYPSRVVAPKNPSLPSPIPTPILTSKLKIAKPRVLIPVFPGTNCEQGTERAFKQAGALVQTLVITNLTPEHLSESLVRMQKALSNSQILFIPGGFSGGDEPSGAGKMIQAFFSSPRLQEAIMQLLNKQDGLIGGICNGFQALLRLGLLLYGDIRPLSPQDPILLHNTLLAHRSKIAYVRVLSNASPWLSCAQVGEIYAVPISHGEGRFYAPTQTLTKLASQNQIATQYVNLEGELSAESNPNGSLCNIEGITSACGRVFGKMGHTERFKHLLYKNIPGNFKMDIFKGAVGYFE